jgi:CubicO group peptidase (beta-lactamase class C family)
MKYFMSRRTLGTVPLSIRALVMLTVGAPALTAQSGQANPRTLDSIAAAGVLANRAVGLVAAVVKGSDTLLMKAYGKADLEWDVPMTTDAMFEVGSIAKQFAAAAILQLRDEGKLSLEDDITKWLPVPVDAGGATVTLRRMLSHTSGVNHFQDNPELGRLAWNPRMPRDSVYRFIRITPLQYPTGDAQAYNNSAFWLLGLVVEKASGMKYEDYLARKIFEPLGMTRSMYCDHGANVPRRAHGYHRLPEGLRRAVILPYSLVFAPGAICSTAGDLVTWLKALHGGKVLSPASYTEMTTQATLNDGTAVQYGLGIKVGEDYRGLKYIGHGGTAPGFRANAAWYPEAQMAVVVLMNTSPTNLDPGGVGGALAAQVLPIPRPTRTPYTGDAAELMGTYKQTIGGNQTGATIQVTSTAAGLAFSVNGSRPETLPWVGGLKFYAQEDVTLTFRRANGETGPVTELRRDNAGNLAILKKQ